MNCLVGYLGGEDGGDASFAEEVAAEDSEESVVFSGSMPAADQILPRDVVLPLPKAQRTQEPLPLLPAHLHNSPQICPVLPDKSEQQLPQILSHVLR